jgi:hypothetical protein
MNKHSSFIPSIVNVKKFYDIESSGQYYKFFTAIITPLAAYFSMILTELRW